MFALFNSSDSSWAGGPVAGAAAKPKKKKSKPKGAADASDKKAAGAWDPFKEFVCCTQRDRLSEEKLAALGSAEAPAAPALRPQAATTAAEAADMASSKRPDQVPALPPPDGPPPDVRKGSADGPQSYRADEGMLMEPTLAKKEYFHDMPEQLDSARNDDSGFDIEAVAASDGNQRRRHTRRNEAEDEELPQSSKRPGEEKSTEPGHGEHIYARDAEGNIRDPDKHEALRSADDVDEEALSDDSLSSDGSYQKRLTALSKDLEDYTKKTKKKRGGAPVLEVGRSQTAGMASMDSMASVGSISINPVVDTVSIPANAMQSSETMTGSRSQRRVSVDSSMAGSSDPAQYSQGNAGSAEESEEPSSGGEDDEERINSRYDRRMCHDRAEALREQMKQDGFSAAPIHEGKKRQLTNKHTDEFVDTMGEKMKGLASINLKDSEAEKLKRSLKRSTDPAEAVRDAVGRYYKQCEELGIQPPAAGRSGQNQDGLDHTARKRLQRNVKDLLQEDGETSYS